MLKSLFQFAIIVALFFLIWFGFSKVNWYKILRIERVTKSTEEKLGNLYWDIISKSEEEVKTLAILKPIDSLVSKLCASNNIDEKKLKIHIVNKDVINAFALPNNHLVIYTGLISSCENEGELLGVLGHEISHIQKNHIMKKLVKETGLALLISITTQGGDGGAVQETLRMLTSSAYDRKLETEADMTSVDYLINAKVNPEHFANFLYRLSSGEENIPKQLYWISTHPESKVRAEEIVHYIKKKKFETKQILGSDSWNNLKIKIKDL